MDKHRARQRQERRSNLPFPPRIAEIDPRLSQMQQRRGGQIGRSSLSSTIRRKQTRIASYSVGFLRDLSDL